MYKKASMRDLCFREVVCWMGAGVLTLRNPWCQASLLTVVGDKPLWGPCLGYECNHIKTLKSESPNWVALILHYCQRIR